MNEILGLLDALEAIILEGKRVPLTEKIILEEKPLLNVIDKIRLVIKSNGAIVRQSVDLSPAYMSTSIEGNSVPPSYQQAQSFLREAEKIRSGAADYADQVLSQLQLMVTKMQKDIMRLDRNIENGRDILKHIGNDTAESQAEESKYHSEQGASHDTQ